MQPGATWPVQAVKIITLPGRPQEGQTFWKVNVYEAQLLGGGRRRAGEEGASLSSPFSFPLPWNLRTAKGPEGVVGVVFGRVRGLTL